MAALANEYSEKAFDKSQNMNGWRQITNSQKTCMLSAGHRKVTETCHAPMKKRIPKQSIWSHQKAVWATLRTEAKNGKNSA
jgi:hypothetical protein